MLKWIKPKGCLYDERTTQALNRQTIKILKQTDKNKNVIKCKDEDDFFKKLNLFY